MNSETCWRNKKDAVLSRPTASTKERKTSQDEQQSTWNFEINLQKKVDKQGKL